MESKSGKPSDSQTPKLTDAQIIDWIVADLNRQIAQFEHAPLHSRFDVSARIAFTVSPGDRITKAHVIDFVYTHGVGRVIKELLK